LFGNTHSYRRLINRQGDSMLLELLVIGGVSGLAAYATNYWHSKGIDVKIDKSQEEFVAKLAAALTAIDAKLTVATTSLDAKVNDIKSEFAVLLVENCKFREEAKKAQDQLIKEVTESHDQLGKQIKEVADAQKFTANTLTNFMQRIRLEKVEIDKQNKDVRSAIAALQKEIKKGQAVQPPQQDNAAVEPATEPTEQPQPQAA
jgi:hypothetical protein